jgi:hypothetical protein
MVMVLDLGPRTLNRWYRPAADTTSVVDLAIRDKILNFPDNFLSCALTEMPDIVNGKGKRNLDHINDLYNGDKSQERISASDPHNHSTTPIVLFKECEGHLYSLAYRPTA